MQQKEQFLITMFQRLKDRTLSIYFRVEREEFQALAWAFIWFFFLLLGYFVLRPVRETMGIAGGVRELRWLFFATFGTMLFAVPLYSWLVARFSRRFVVPIVYRFFAANLLVFWFLLSSTSEPSPWIARVFFVWVSFYNLFAVSVFWSVLADLFSSQQAKRLFGFVAGGGTAGAIVGSLLTSQLVQNIGIAKLLLIPIVLLEVGLFCAWQLQRSAKHFRAATSAAPPPTGGGIFSGIESVLRSPYLLSICGYIFLISLCGTTVYFQQAEIVESTVKDAAARTSLFAKLNLYVQILTLVIQTLITGQLMRWRGIAFALCIPPVVYACGFVGLGVHPVLATLIIVDVARRAAIYGVAVPAREVLFTVVNREEKYKSKSFIDTVVVRGGDALTGQIFSQLRLLGVSLSSVAFLMIPVTILWAMLGWSLGRQQSRRTDATKQI